MRTLVVVPVFNEMDFIESFYENLRRNYKGKVLFINDGSFDGSYDYLKKMEMLDDDMILINNNVRTGYGFSLIKGFKFALGNGFDSVITIDSDLQHDPKYINAFKELLENFDVVLGSRYIKFLEIYNVPKERFLINRYIRKLLKVKFGFDFSDPFCGYRGYRKNFLEIADLSDRSYGIAIEILLEIIYRRINYTEISVDLIYDKNKKREFLDGLDNAKKRLLYYIDVIEKKRRFYEEKNNVYRSAS